MRKIMCFDMDMTLLDHKAYEIPSTALAAVEELRKKGHLIVIASGRDMENVFSLKLAQKINPDAIVHNNGLKVTVGQERIYESFMEPALIDALLSFGEERGICIGFNIGETAHYTNKELVIQRETELFGSCDRKFGDVRELVRVPMHALCMFGTKEQADEIADAFPNLRLPMFSGNVGADIIDKNVSKAEGIGHLLKYYQMDWKDVVAFGDSMNDLEMVQKAGLGIAMGNAVEELKELADFVTKPVDQHGIAYALAHYGFID